MHRSPGSVLAVVAIALIGGIVPALPAALAAALLADYYFTPPLHSLRVERLVDILTLVIYVVTAAIVGTAAGAAAHRTYQAVRASSEARALSRLATAMMHGQDLPALLEQVREDFGLDAVSLLERDARHAAEHTRASLLLIASRDLRDPLRSAEEARTTCAPRPMPSRPASSIAPGHRCGAQAGSSPTSTSSAATPGRSTSTCARSTSMRS